MLVRLASTAGSPQTAAFKKNRLEQCPTRTHTPLSGSCKSSAKPKFSSGSQVPAKPCL
ncbi:hypothetical protein BS50DRAFT_571287 [Corynespora cassiicola Philippines]|uniref:Uncharacterized protein n=1 Tax=Corynespora cassiicola Philippines TaxID=1448308 RepID=A0A2T2NX34_CORCC|nr:hypothetical protein BS50DRAFT_571287 [Corynespora cassiicola Philippines]